ncbi:hypothetical protein NDU88_005976 [Pleurodeles waltl]|uniref:Uncharacterized protein n=1 Tax=Pleurodeles waltl TaxID=8319 RepID=A0AAV7LMN6_PLEWA|nr:hypothetical protein NDU88_005976 [Pleurodeles waltl]
MLRGLEPEGFAGWQRKAERLSDFSWPRLNSTTRRGCSNDGRGGSQEYRSSASKNQERHQMIPMYSGVC